tara:strand:- start:667 stop:816 length:150 start_codon:yes stop_codon:yes gene_type:complete
MLEGWRASYYLEAFRIIGSRGREEAQEGRRWKGRKERKEGHPIRPLYIY